MCLALLTKFGFDFPYSAVTEYDDDLKSVILLVG